MPSATSLPLAMPQVRTRNGYRFSCIAGTIFENTKKPLRDWFSVTHFMLTSKKGISALQIQRMMGFGSYETAHWRMCHKIRAALIEPETKLGGIVEVDETFVGGKAKNRHWDKRGRARHGRSWQDHCYRCGEAARATSSLALSRMSAHRTLGKLSFAKSFPNKVSLLCTDECGRLSSISARDFKHAFVNHAEGQYVVGAVHTQTIEGFWSMLKRGIIGSFHKVSRKYLPLYVAEFQFRYNNRTQR